MRKSRNEGYWLKGWLMLLALGFCGRASLVQAIAPTTVSVNVSQAWTDTGISVSSGSKVIITASGSMNYWPGGCTFASCVVSPAGIPWPGPCSSSVPAPGLACVSLIGMIGSGAPFNVGTSTTVTAASAGELFLGVNDDNFSDNTGAWTAQITVQPLFKPYFSQQTKDDYTSAAIGFGAASAIGSSLAQNAICRGLRECAKLMGAFATVGSVAQNGFDYLAADPVDPNFTVIAEPVFVPFPQPFLPESLPRGTACIFDALQINGINQLAYARVILTSSNRYEGAAIAGNAEWEEKQLLAGKKYSLEMGFLQKQQAALLSILQWMLKEDQFPIFTVTPADFSAYAAQVATSGLPMSLQTALTQDGVTSADLQTLTQQLETPASTKAQSFPAVLTSASLVGNLQTTAADLLNFAADRNADGIVNCLDLSLVEASMGLNSTNASFDPRADVNGDGRINWVDYFLVKQQLPLGLNCR